MTPGEHIAEAERLVGEAANDATGWGNAWSQSALLAATTHALIAVAVELGVPHAPAAPGGEQGAPQAPPG